MQQGGQCGLGGGHAVKAGGGHLLGAQFFFLQRLGHSREGEGAYVGHGSSQVFRLRYLREYKQVSGSTHAPGAGPLGNLVLRVGADCADPVATARADWWRARLP